MSISTDTDDLLSTSLWGEVLIIIRNDPDYGNFGEAGDHFDVMSNPNGDIQRVSGNNPTRNLGQGRFMTHTIFLPNNTDVKQGDRIRTSDWTAGRAEYFVEQVLSDEGHVELKASLARTMVKFLLVETGELLLLEDGEALQMENY